MSADLQRSLAMFRFNFWPKPLFAPIPGAGGMDNPAHSFMPNPLTSPALMVLASTASAEGHEAPRLPGAHPPPPPNPFPGQSGMDKDLPPPPPFSSAAAGFTMYRPGDPFPTPLYSPLSLMRPSMEQRLAMMNPAAMRTAGAFRPLGATGSNMDGVSGSDGSSYHSAFSPTKKVKTEDSAASSSSSLDLSGTHSGGDNRYREGSAERDGGPTPPEMKEERPSSLSSAGCDTISEPLSDSGDGYERGTPDSDGRALRKLRKRSALDGQAPCCPICGLTLRSGELEAHFLLEIEKLEKICRGGRKSRDTTPQGRKSLTSPSGSRKGKDSPPPELASRARYDSFLRIRCNRQSRLSSRSRNKKKKPGEDGVKETSCPICNERLIGLPEEMNAHVEICLKQRSDGGDEDEAVDVEGEYEEYEWAGQTRVRATTMLQGGFAASGFQTMSSKRMSDEDVELDVDGDDSDQFGKPQFCGKDVIPLEAEDGEIAGPSTSGQASIPEYNYSSTSSGRPSFPDERLNQNCDQIDGAQGSELVSALKTKLRDMEEAKTEKQKCLICMEPYRTPLTSIQCWHVHCQSCWLKTLGVKKLCPQCNMITSPSDLRRIFL